MNTTLHIGAEEEYPSEEYPFVSRHLLDLKHVDQSKKSSAHRNVSVNLKEEIRFKKEAGRICIVGEMPRSKQGLGRAPMILAALFMIFALNLGQLIFLGRGNTEEALALAGEAIVSLKDAGASFISGEPGSESLFFDEANEHFLQAEKQAGFLLNHSSKWLSEPDKVQSLRNLLEAGQLMSETGKYMGQARVALNALPEEASLTDSIRQISEDYLEPAALNLGEIQSLLAGVDLSGTEYALSFGEYKDNLNSIAELFELWMEVKEPLLLALGDRVPQHYLVLFENNNEMRRGGGFIGSYAIVEINDGRISNLDFKDVYELDNAFFTHVEVPDPELKHLTTEWRLRDSNNSMDFPTSAEQAIHFLDIEGGPGVDGVLAVNLSAAQSLVEVLGELHLPSLNAALTAENFPAVLSTLVEAKTSGAQNPKSILAELLDSFLLAAKDPTQKMLLGETALKEVQKKQILLYHRNESVEGLLTSLGLDASIPDFNTLEGDFASVEFTNMGGNKTDAYMQGHLQHDTQVLSDGTLVDSLTLSRQNNFTPESLAWLKNVSAQYGFTQWDKNLERILGNDINRTGIRFYLPEGVEILEVTGDVHKDDLQFLYDPVLQSSYYYLDQSIAPGTAQSFTLHYTLPWQLKGNFPEYHFQLFKQPGLKGMSYEKTMAAPSDILLSSEPLATEHTEDKDYILGGALDQDVRVKLLYR